MSYQAAGYPPNIQAKASVTHLSCSDCSLPIGNGAVADEPEVPKAALEEVFGCQDSAAMIVHAHAR